MRDDTAKATKHDDGKPRWDLFPWDVPLKFQYLPRLEYPTASAALVEVGRYGVGVSGVEGIDRALATIRDLYYAPGELQDGRMFRGAVDVLTFGARKYGAHNWRRGLAQSRLVAAACRHLYATIAGEPTDPESGLPHLAHATTTLLMLRHFAARGEHDDRYIAPAPAAEAPAPAIPRQKCEVTVYSATGDEVARWHFWSPPDYARILREANAACDSPACVRVQRGSNDLLFWPSHAGYSSFFRALLPFAGRWLALSDVLPPEITARVLPLPPEFRHYRVVRIVTR